MPSPIDYLINAQHETGGWGYYTAQKPVVEPTAAVLLAIRDEPLAYDSFQKGLTWLLRSQHQDGGWGINENDIESGWQTAWALIALRYSTQNNEVISKAADWLKSVATVEITQEEFLKPELPSWDNYSDFIWPWLPGQGGWIEPTALALLALEGMDNSQLATARKNAALSYFQQYRTPEGGWALGNEGPLDTIVTPRAYPTALVLMALNHIAQQEIQTIDLHALRQDLQTDPSMLAQSVGLLAMQTLGESDEAISTNITDHQLSNGSWDNNPFFTAWAIMALRGYL